MNFIKMRNSFTWLLSIFWVGVLKPPFATNKKRHSEGSDLLAKVQTLRSLPEGKAAKILRQILSAMDTCHKKNIVHRDLKPENILFEGHSIESTVKVIDFGRSKLLQPTQKIMERAGSLFYMAPEVLLCKEYNQQCDIWSAGVILYLLLAGTPPFYAKTREETVQKVTDGRPEFKGLIFSPPIKSIFWLANKKYI